MLLEHGIFSEPQFYHGQSNPLMFICAFVGVNAVVEILAGSVVGGTVAKILHKALKNT